MEIKAKEIIVDGNTSYKYYKPKFCCKALEENPRIIISNEYPDAYLCRTCETVNYEKMYQAAKKMLTK